MTGCGEGAGSVGEARGPTLKVTVTLEGVRPHLGRGAEASGSPGADVVVDVLDTEPGPTDVGDAPVTCHAWCGRSGLARCVNVVTGRPGVGHVEALGPTLAAMTGLGEERSQAETLVVVVGPSIHEGCTRSPHGVARHGPSQDVRSVF